MQSFTDASLARPCRIVPWLAALLALFAQAVSAQSVVLSSESIPFARPAELTINLGGRFTVDIETEQSTDGALRLEIHGQEPAFGINPGSPDFTLDLRDYFDLQPGTYRLDFVIRDFSRTLLAETFRFEVRDSRFQIGPALSGSWFDPEQSGHGLQLEFLNNQQAYGYWYAYDDDGEPLWLVGIGRYAGDEADFDVSTAEGRFFPPAYDTDSHRLTPWGRWKLTFNGCSQGAIAWVPDVGGFEAGEMPLQKLSPPNGMPCVDDDEAVNAYNSVNLLADDPQLAFTSSNSTSEEAPEADNWTALFVELPAELGSGTALKVTPHPNDDVLNLQIPLFGPGRAASSTTPYEPPVVLDAEVVAAVPRRQLCDASGSLGIVIEASGLAFRRPTSSGNEGSIEVAPEFLGGFLDTDKVVDCETGSEFVVRTFRSSGRSVMSSIPEAVQLSLTFAGIEYFEAPVEGFYVLDFNVSFRSVSPTDR